MAVAAMQGADLYIRSSYGFSILPKDTSKCRPGESNQQSSDNKTLAEPQSPSIRTSQLLPLRTLQPPLLRTLSARRWQEGRALFGKNITSLGTLHVPLLPAEQQVGLMKRFYICLSLHRSTLGKVYLYCTCRKQGKCFT